MEWDILWGNEIKYPREWPSPLSRTISKWPQYGCIGGFYLCLREDSNRVAAKPVCEVRTYCRDEWGEKWMLGTSQDPVSSPTIFHNSCYHGTVWLITKINNLTSKGAGCTESVRFEGVRYFMRLRNKISTRVTESSLTHKENPHRCGFLIGKCVAGNKFRIGYNYYIWKVLFTDSQILSLFY